jgi:flagellar protein FliS
MYEAAARSYRQTNVLSADPLKLIHLCYEGAISSLKLARDAYVEQDYETKGKALVRTFDIIHELNASLDMKKGGDVAKNLRALYLYMTQALTEADLNKNLKVFDDVIRMIEELKSAWQEIAGELSRNVSCPTLQVIPNALEKTSVVSRIWSA